MADTPIAQGREAARRFRAGESAGSHAQYVVNPDALAALFESENGAVAKGLLKLALRVEREAKHLCPVDTGRLRASIAARLEREGDSFIGVVGTNVKYAAAVELGSHHELGNGTVYDITAQPFLTPALFSITGQAARAETRNMGNAA